MPARYALYAALLMLPGAALGQTFPDLDRQLGVDRVGTSLRVSETFVVQTPAVPAANLEEQEAIIRTTHKVLIDLAARGCDLLSEALKADCRMTSLNLNDSNQAFRNQSGVTLWSAMAQFELRPRPSPASNAGQH